MSHAKAKIFTVLKICLAIFGCLIVSISIYLGSSIFVYAAWHCPPPCEHKTPMWIDLTILLIFLSPFLVFTIGAYLCRNAIYSLTESKILRVLLLLFFAFFPIFLFVGFVFYAVNSP